MSYYRKNLVYLKENAPALYLQLMQESEKYNVVIEKTEDLYIIRRESHQCYMHSIYSKENEILNMFKNVNPLSEVAMLFGIGDGSALIYLLKNFKNLKSVIVIEPSLSIFKEFLEIRDFESDFKAVSLKDINISFAVNQTESFVSELSRKVLINNKIVSVCYHVYCSSLFGDYFNNVKSTIQDKLKNSILSVVTVSAQWKKWMINSFRNLNCKNVLPIECLKEFFRNSTVIIVSAGPSLNKNIRYLEELKKHAIVIAVGSAIKILDTNEIKPHFRAAIDGNPAEKRIFESLKSQDVDLLFSNQLYYDILPHYSGSMFRYILNTDFLGKYIYNTSEMEYVEFKSGFSVANGALDLVCALGCKRVVFMGQDLSYKDNGLHAEGLTEEAKETDKEWLNSMREIKMKDIHGETVYTINQYISMKSGLEDTIKNYPGIEFINASEGGLGIEGTSLKTAVELLADLNVDGNFIDEKSILKIDNRVINEYQSNIEKGLSIYSKELIEVKRIHQDIFSHLKKIEKVILKKGFGRKSFNDIVYVEKLFNELREINLYCSVIEPELRADIFVIRDSLTYKGEDEIEAMRCRYRILLGITNKITEHMELSKELLNELSINKIEKEVDYVK